MYAGQGENNRLQDFRTLHETSRDFMRFVRLQKISWDFTRLHVWSLCCFPLAAELVIWATELEKFQEFLPFGFNHIVKNTAKTIPASSRPINKPTKKVLQLAQQQQISPPARLKTHMNQALLWTARSQSERIHTFYTLFCFLVVFYPVDHHPI